MCIFVFFLVPLNIIHGKNICNKHDYLHRTLSRGKAYAISEASNVLTKTWQFLVISSHSGVFWESLIICKIFITKKFHIQIFYTIRFFKIRELYSLCVRTGLFNIVETKKFTKPRQFGNLYIVELHFNKKLNILLSQSSLLFAFQWTTWNSNYWLTKLKVI